MAIRTGILCTPQLDEDATSAILSLLRRQQLPIILIHEAAAGSQRNWIEETLRRWCDEDELDLVLTVGGTMPAAGPSQRQCMPEATLAILERSLPGFAENMRSVAKMQTSLALLDRGVCGIRGRTLIINLPKGVAPAVLFLETVTALIPAVIAHLQENADAPAIEDELELIEDDEDNDKGEFEPNAKSSVAQYGLKSEDFAKFLQRRSGEKSV